MNFFTSPTIYVNFSSKLSLSFFCMASYLNRSLCLCPLRLLSISKIQSYLCLHHSVKDDTGVLDDFTSQLVQQKSYKWERRKSIAEKKSKCDRLLTNSRKENAISINIDDLDIDTINDSFQRAIDYGDRLTIVDLTKQCIKYNKVPSLIVLLHALSICSQKGDNETIIEVSKLCEKVRPEILQENSNFEHYMAEAVWIKGDVIKSLKMFERVYRENVYLRRTIRSILRYLISDSIVNHSEAIVINLVQFADKLVKEYNDYFPLGCLWQACMLSEWFSDHQLALDLLDKYPHLRIVIVNKIPFVVRISVKKDRIEIVYRLTESLLKFEMKSEIGQVLLALLNYWIQQGDFRRCKEIVLWSLKNDVEVPTVIHNEKLMKLFAQDIVDFNCDVKSKLPRRTPTDYKF